MAKAKKTEIKEETKPASKAPAAKGKAAKPAKPQGGNALGIDTNLVAQAAAMAVGNKALMNERQDDASDAKKETSTFKQLKESLAKPGGSSLSNLLHAGGGPEAKKSNLPFGGGKQVGRNQTFGADVAKSGVPRRNPG